MLDLGVVEWAVRALSLFNTVAFTWLGLTVLLNARERKPVTWIAGAGLVAAGLFFAVHTTLVGREMGTFEPELAFWWNFSWLLYVVPPYGWYLVAGWYTGAFDRGPDRLQLVTLGVLGALVLALIALPDALPDYEATVQGDAGLLSVQGVPATVLAYPAYGVLCFVLALAVLNHPGPSARFMGDLGRQRAKPWLVAATLLLLAVSVGAGAALIWVVQTAVPLDLSSQETARLLLTMDLAISLLLALIVVFAGRAIVSYEIFTGTVLPRGGLRRHWWNSLVLAGGYGVLMGGSLNVPVDPIYRLMLATLLVAVFYALLSWRSYLERERSIQQLRPFVTGQRLYDQLLDPSGPLEVDVEVPFRALCDDLLGARIAFLMPMGWIAPLVEKPLCYPTRATTPTAAIGSIVADLRAPGVLTVPLDPAKFGGAIWAVSLWSERGLVGALLIGPKRDGGLYVQEEIEVARSACERLLDIQASTGMARRLMAVQRRRMGETQVLDRHARRVLHDEVLPQLHTALLSLSTGSGSTAEVVQGLTEVHHRISDLLRAMPASSPDLSRFGLVRALRALVEGELGGSFDGVAFKADPEVEQVARGLTPLVAEAVYGAVREAVRNAARHGRGTEQSRPLHLEITVSGVDGLRFEIEDDGVGLGVSSNGGGSGQGLALHGTMMAVIGGTLSVEPVMGGGTRVVVSLPPQATLPGSGIP